MLGRAGCQDISIPTPSGQGFSVALTSLGMDGTIPQQLERRLLKPPTRRWIGGRRRSDQHGGSPDSQTAASVRPAQNSAAKSWSVDSRTASRRRMQGV